jgi:imidazoleglycerol phosphate synthase glutamine amidotransferase subunit HisH
VIRCRDSESRPICRIGWYELLRYPGNDPKIDVVDAEVKGPFYFCHSFYCSPTVDHRSTYIINDSTQHVGMVLSDRRLALQFHPERSGKQGIALLADFAGGGHAKKQ